MAVGNPKRGIPAGETTGSLPPYSETHGHVQLQPHLAEPSQPTPAWPYLALPGSCSYRLTSDISPLYYKKKKKKKKKKKHISTLLSHPPPLA